MYIISPTFYELLSLRRINSILKWYQSYLRQKLGLFFFVLQLMRLVNVSSIWLVLRNFDGYEAYFSTNLIVYRVWEFQSFFLFFF